MQGSPVLRRGGGESRDSSSTTLNEGQDYTSNYSTFERMKDKLRLSRRYSFTGKQQSNNGFSISRSSSRASLFGFPISNRYGNDTADSIYKSWVLSRVESSSID